MSRHTVSVIATLKAKPGKAEEVRAVATGLLGPTRKEPGCIRYELFVNEADPEEFTFIEEWSSGDALSAHLATAHLLDAKSRWPELLARDVDLRRYAFIG